MKKLHISVKLSFVGALIVICFIVLDVTGVFNFYIVPTISMQPVITNTNWVIASTRIKPVNGRVIVFNYHEQSGYTVPYVRQLVALPGDTIKIRNGYVYRNGKFADDTSAIYFIYKMPTEVYSHYSNIIGTNEDRSLKLMTGNTIVYLKPSELNIFSPEDKPILTHYYIDTTYSYNDTPILTDSTLFCIKHHGSRDFLGPLVVPKDSCFVIGANRDNSMDSRYFGFVALKDIRGVVINH